MDQYNKLLFDSEFKLGLYPNKSTMNQESQLKQQDQQQTFSFGGQSYQQQSGIKNTPNLQKDNIQVDNQSQIHQIYDDDFKKNTLQQEVNSLNQHLNAFGYMSLGDLFNPTNQNIEQTIRTVFSLLSQRQSDMEQRKEFLHRISQEQSEKQLIQQSLEKTYQKIKTLESEKENLLQNRKLMEATYSKDKERLQQDNKEIQNCFSKIQSRESQFQNDIRKKEKDLQQLKEQLRKCQNDKNSSNWKNSFEIVNQLEASGTLVISLNADHEFSSLISKVQEDKFQKLLADNEILKEGLMSVHKEINEMLAVRKEIFLRRKKIEYGGDSSDQGSEFLKDLTLIPFKKEIFQLETENIGKDAIELLQENIRRFKQYMEKLDQEQSPLETENDQETENEIDKIKAMKSLKSLIKNYKCVVESQDDLLRKAISKNNDYQVPKELDYNNQNRFQRILNDQELESTKKFLQDQKKYLEEKHNELESTKKQMSTTVKRLDDEKNLIIEKRKELENETEQYKENIMNLLNSSKNMFEEQQQSLLQQQGNNNYNKQNNFNFKTSPDKMEIQ